MQKHENKTQTVVLSKHPNRFKGEIEDLRGKKFGELIVINFDKKDHLGRAKWLCRCSCGKMTSVLGYHLKAGAIKSCGHLNHQKDPNALTRTNWYSNYKSMIKRVTNPNENDRKFYNHNRINGPLIDPEWRKDAWTFYQEIGPKKHFDDTIDRINPKLGYVKGNVRWASKSLQALNRINKELPKSGYRGILLAPAGENRRAHNRYIPMITIHKKPKYLGHFYNIDNAKRVRYDIETKYHLTHTFERPAGPIEKEPDYNYDPLRGIKYDETRRKWRVNIHGKYLGQTDTKEEAIKLRDNPQKAKEQLASRHNQGIIVISPQGNKQRFSSIAAFHKFYKTHANVNRFIKNKKPITSRRSKFYGCLFKYATGHETDIPLTK